MIKTLITGATGFIGSHLSRKLGIEGIRYYDIIESGEADRFFFLSTYGNMASHTDHYMMIRANVMDLQKAISREHEWFCYMSSSSVLLPVQTSYSRTKRAAEEILQALPELKSCIVRPYSVTGVGEQKEHLIPTLIRSCMEGEEMPFDRSPVHDFVDVSDIVDALVYLADNQMTGIYELGSGIPHDNQSVKEMVEHFCQKKANTREQKSLRPYDNNSWFCKNMPTWFWPKKTLAQSIEEMVEEYKREPIRKKGN